MFPWSPNLHLKHGQTRPNDLQRQRIETQLNLTNSSFFSHTLNFIPTYQWKPAPPAAFTSPNGSRTKTRKRKGGDHGADDLKRQRFNSPHSNEALDRTSGFSPVIRGQHGLAREPAGDACSPASSNINSPGTSKTDGCIPSLREESPHSPYSSFPPFLVKDKLSQQILDLFVACEQRSEDLERKESCRAQLQRDIQRLFPCARVFLAGSSLNGFGSRSSDADLCLVVQDGLATQRSAALRILSHVQKLLYKLYYIQRPQLIHAKVPILKFRDRISGVEFDLNVNNVVGIRNTFLLRTYAYIDKRVRPIILVIKKWASHHRINDASRGTLSSYSLVLMVLHYLQTLPEPVIPCLQKDYPECFRPTMDIHLVPDGPKNIPPFVSKNQSSLGDLLLGFLKYYATVFRWDKTVISVREAKALPKPNSWEWKEKFICVEEPFDGTNTARAVHEKMKFDAIKTQFTESWQVLQLRKDLNYILPSKEQRPKR